MSSSLLHPAGNLSPATAMKLSQKAPAILKESRGAVSSPLMSLFSTEAGDMWVTYENLMLSCLRTGDEVSAHQCLERLVTRFGEDNERVMALKGLLKESAAADDKALLAVLKEYDDILEENDANIVGAPPRKMPLTRRSFPAAQPAPSQVVRPLHAVAAQEGWRYMVRTRLC